MIPPHLKSNFGPVVIAQAPIDNDANVNVGNNGIDTPLYQGLEGEHNIVIVSVQHLTRAWVRCAGTK